MKINDNCTQSVYQCLAQRQCLVVVVMKITVTPIDNDLIYSLGQCFVS